MIDAAINHIAGQLNQFLVRSFDLNEDVVVVSNVLEQDGNVAPHINNKLVVFLANIEKDTSPQRLPFQPPAQFVGADRAIVSTPPLYLNLYLMVAAAFSGSNYPEALKFISNAIGFFQRQPVFDHTNTPELDDRINKLVMEMENLNIHDMSNLWGVISGKYLPSVLYKMRMVAIDAGDVRSQVPVMKAPQSFVK